MVDVEGLIKSIQNDWHVSENEANFVIAALKAAEARMWYNRRKHGCNPMDYGIENLYGAESEFAALYERQKEVGDDR